MVEMTFDKAYAPRIGGDDLIPKSTLTRIANRLLKEYKAVDHCADYGIPEEIKAIAEKIKAAEDSDELIYEGDIVKIDDKYLRYVAYSGEHTAFCAMHYIDKQQSELTGTLGDGYDNYKRSYEVVGNIYDNHEILEVPF